MNPKGFFGELKRRNVYRVAVAYAIVGWLLVQIATQVFPFFEIPNWAIRLVVILLILGFPIALILAWAFDLTPEGIKRADEVMPNESTAKGGGRKRFQPSVHPGYVTPKSIAVLPFKNLSDDKQSSYFADGVQDEILTYLAKIADLKVISRTSVMLYKTEVARDLCEIGQQLGVAHLLEGSVQRAGGKVRVNAQLIDVRTDAHLWAQTYDRDLADVFAIQSEIAKAIADQLQAKLSRREKAAIEQAPTSDINAFDSYTRAKDIILTTALVSNEPGMLLQVVDLLNQAVAHDSSFFDAYCLLAYTHDRLYFIGHNHTPARLALAKAAIEAAFHLRPEAGEAHLAHAQHVYNGYLDYDAALAELELARRTLPNDPRVLALTGYILRRQNKREQAIKYLQSATELDPRNCRILQETALTYQHLRRYGDMADTLERSLAIKPDDVAAKVTRASVELDWKGDTGPLHQTIDSILAENPAAIQSVAGSWFMCALAERDAAAAERALVAMGQNELSVDTAVFLSPRFAKGLLARMTKDEAKARAAFTAARAEQEETVRAQPDHGPVLCVLGLIDAGLGRKEEALREGRRAVELCPIEKDAVNGIHMTDFLAIIAAWIGDKDLACQQLEDATRRPGYLSYGQLKLLPFWDPLRGYSRFEKIVASLAPKYALANGK
jgi:TolB-like protein/Flp pilus assembly protein TadD